MKITIQKLHEVHGMTIREISLFLEISEKKVREALN